MPQRTQHSHLKDLNSGRVVPATPELERTMRRYGTLTPAPDPNPPQQPAAQSATSQPQQQTEPDNATGETFQLKHRSAGWYDVVDTRTGNPVNQQAMRQAEAEALATEKQAEVG